MKRNSPFAMLRSPRKDRSSYDHIFEDDDLEELPLSAKKTNFLEKQVLPDDTLQSIALEFNVAVAELKRVNNIHKDNEIFARKIIKIPHKPYSLLLESKFFNEKTKDIEPIPGPSTATKDGADILVEIVNNSSSTPLSPQSAVSSPAEEQCPGETDVLLRTERIDSPELTALKCNGADGNLSGAFLLFVVVLLGIVGPAFYVWYFWIKVETHS